MTLDLDGSPKWSAVRACVAGIGVAGFASAKALALAGASVIAVDRGTSAEHELLATRLRDVGAEVRLGDGDSLPEGVDLLVVSPGFPPNAPIIAQALKRGVEVWGELELAWRLRGPGAAPWLAITGTNGKTTTCLMLESMLRAAGHRAIAAGNIGVSLVGAVVRGGLDVIAVEVSSHQLPFWHTVSPLAAVCLNVSADHLDHFGTMDAYIATKARVFDRCQIAAVYNIADQATRRMAEAGALAPGCRVIGFGPRPPQPGQLGVVDDHLVDRAFGGSAADGVEIASLSDVRPFAPHNVANALAAASLARAFGIDEEAVGEGLRQFVPARHRMADLGMVGDVRFVDDSKATNVDAARTALMAQEPVVWIAGGTAKGQDFDELVRDCADRMRGVVLLGADRGLILEALRRHAPGIPVVEVRSTDTGAVGEVVAAAVDMAQPGDTVLLAPGCASWDMFDDYAQRGDRFAEEVVNLREARGESRD